MISAQYAEFILRKHGPFRRDVDLFTIAVSECGPCFLINIVKKTHILRISKSLFLGNYGPCFSKGIFKMTHILCVKTFTFSL